MCKAASGHTWSQEGGRGRCAWGASPGDAQSSFLLVLREHPCRGVLGSRAGLLCTASLRPAGLSPAMLLLCHTWRGSGALRKKEGKVHVVGTGGVGWKQGGGEGRERKLDSGVASLKGLHAPPSSPRVCVAVTASPPKGQEEQCGNEVTGEALLCEGESRVPVSLHFCPFGGLDTGGVEGGGLGGWALAAG